MGTDPFFPYHDPLFILLCDPFPDPDPDPNFLPDPDPDHDIIYIFN